MWHVLPGAGAQRHPSRKSYILRPGLRCWQRAQPIPPGLSAEASDSGPSRLAQLDLISPYARDVVDVRDAFRWTAESGCSAWQFQRARRRIHLTCFLAESPVLTPALF